MFPYENLEVYKKAYTANQHVYRLLKDSNNIPRYAKDQLGRASLSIMLNIAEGSAKFSNRDRRNFYVTARGSAFECSSLISFFARRGRDARRGKGYALPVLRRNFKNAVYYDKKPGRGLASAIYSFRSPFPPF